MIYIPLYVLFWFLCERVIKLVSGKRFDSKWSSNLVSSVHSVGTCVKCYASLNGYGNINQIINFSVSYFLYDIRNYGFKSVYFIHHVFSTLALVYLINHPEEEEQVLKGFLLTELGNFPVYIMYCLLTHPNKTYLKKWYLIVLKLEFLWFSFFRVFMVGLVMLRVNKLPVKVVGGVLQIANLYWCSGLLNKMRKR